MIVAIANWQGSISPVFDVSDRLCLIEFENGVELKRNSISLRERNPFARAKEMSGLGIKLLICGAISQALETTLTNSGIRVVGFMCGKIETVLTAILRDQFTESLFMPGCAGRRQKHRFQRRRRANFKRR